MLALGYLRTVIKSIWKNKWRNQVNESGSNTLFSCLVSRAAINRMLLLKEVYK